MLALALMMVGSCFAGTNKEFVVDERYEAEKWSSRHLVGDHQEIDKHEENDNCCDHHSTPRSKYGGGDDPGGKV